MLSCGVFLIKLPPRYNDDGSVRRDKRRFSILKKPFIANPLIDNHHFYIWTKYDKTNNGYSYSCIAFLEDGRFLINSIYIPANAPCDSLSKRVKDINSWRTTYSFGFYTSLAENDIEIQYYKRPTETWSLSNIQVRVSKNGDTVYKYDLPYIKSEYKIIAD